MKLTVSVHIQFLHRTELVIKIVNGTQYVWIFFQVPPTNRSLQLPIQLEIVYLVYVHVGFGNYGSCGAQMTLWY